MTHEEMRKAWLGERSQFTNREVNGMLDRAERAEAEVRLLQEELKAAKAEIEETEKELKTLRREAAAATAGSQDTERLDWLDVGAKRLKKVRRLMGDGCSVRYAIELLMKKGGNAQG